MKIDRELVRAWRALNRVGAVVVAIRYSEIDHLATALVRAGDHTVHAVGWNPSDALDRCRTQIA